MQATRHHRNRQPAEDRGDEAVTTVAARLTLLFFTLIIGGVAARAQETPPPWAYPVNPPGFQRAPDDGSIRHVPNSSAGYTLTQVRDLFTAPDWHAGDHPPMPGVVGTGRKPDVMACGVCHRADGPGGPENSSLFGLPASYIVQQTLDFKNGLRNGSAPRIANDLMIKIAKAVTDEELEVAAAYFASIKPRSNIVVIETATVPKTQVRDLFLALLPGDEKEPIAERIIEIPENVENFVSRDSPRPVHCPRAARQYRQRPAAREHPRRRRGCNARAVTVPI